MYITTNILKIGREHGEWYIKAGNVTLWCLNVESVVEHIMILNA